MQTESIKHVPDQTEQNRCTPKYMLAEYLNKMEYFFKVLRSLQAEITGFLKAEPTSLEDNTTAATELWRKKVVSEELQLSFFFLHEGNGKIVLDDFMQGFTFKNYSSKDAFTGREIN